MFAEQGEHAPTIVARHAEVVGPEEDGGGRRGFGQDFGHPVPGLGQGGRGREPAGRDDGLDDHNEGGDSTPGPGKAKVTAEPQIDPTALKLPANPPKAPKKFRG